MSTRTILSWPQKPKVTHDRLFDLPRRTWRCKSEPGYSISQCVFSDYTLVFPPWADRLPEHFRMLAAAKAAAERHRNGDDER